MCIVSQGAGCFGTLVVALRILHVGGCLSVRAHGAVLGRDISFDFGARLIQGDYSYATIQRIN